MTYQQLPHFQNSFLDIPIFFFFELSAWRVHHDMICESPDFWPNSVNLPIVWECDRWKTGPCILGRSVWNICFLLSVCHSPGKVLSCGHMFLQPVTLFSFVVGNLISLLVLSHDRSKDPTFYSLRALALSDIILLIAAFLQQVSWIKGDSNNFKSSYIKIQSWVRIFMFSCILLWIRNRQWSQHMAVELLLCLLVLGKDREFKKRIG